MENLANIHRMIGDLTHGRNNASETLKNDGIDTLLDVYGIPERQRAAFGDPGWRSFGAIGLHPITQMLLVLGLSPELQGSFSAGRYVDRIWNQTQSQGRR